MTATIVPNSIAAASASASFLGAAAAYLEFRARKTREVEPGLDQWTKIEMPSTCGSVA